MGADASEQFGVVAAGKVGTTDALLEEYIAAEQAAAFCMIKSDMSRGMPRHEHNTELKAAELHAFGLLPPQGGFMAAIHRNAPDLRAPAGPIHWKVKVMKPERQAGVLLHDAGHAAKMIEVGVGEPDGAQLPAARGNASEDFGSIPGRVDDHTIVTIVISDDEAIGDHRSEGHFFNLQHGSFGLPVRIVRRDGVRDYTSAAAGRP